MFTGDGNPSAMPKWLTFILTQLLVENAGFVEVVAAVPGGELLEVLVLCGSKEFEFPL